MRAEILSIGTELLVGSILDTNARFLSRCLAEEGIDVYHRVTVGDNIQRIADAIAQALCRSEIVVASGGLGPTEDDATVRGLARYLGVSLVRHRPTEVHIRQWLTNRGKKWTPLIAKQCEIPAGTSLILPNTNGTAPGIIHETSFGSAARWVILLPGPPRELEPMFDRSVRAIIRRRILKDPASFLTRSLRLSRVAESDIASRIGDVLKWSPPLSVGIYAKPGEVELKIMAKAHDRARAVKLISRAERILRSRLGDRIYGVDDDTLSGVVVRDLLRRGRTLSLAESCTGGLLGKELTDHSGASTFFRGGIIAYSNRLKRDLLGVKESVLEREGAVSAQCARQMAAGVRRLQRTDIGVSITGIAGPGGGSAAKPVGLVYIGLSSASRTKVTRYHFGGDRASVRRQAVQAALDRLRLERP